MATQFYPLTIVNIVKETKDAVVISLDVPAHLKNQFIFNAGQYLTLSTIIDGQPIRRSYSICTSPQENILSVAVKKVEAGIFSTFANEKLKVGDIIEVMPPHGKFGANLQNQANPHYLALACGSGITPIISIIKTILQSDISSTFTLVYSNKNRPSIIFFEALEALKNKYINRFQLVHLLSREKIASPLNFGRINEDKLNELSSVVDYENVTDIFICGPEQMILNSKAFLLTKGVEEKRIHFELFGTVKKQQTNKNEKQADNTEKSDITIILDGRSISFKLGTQEQPILDEALLQGADLPYACKGGVCCTCKAKLIEGTVKMDINYALEKEEVESGYVLACQAHPTSNKVTIDFDIK